MPFSMSLHSTSSDFRWAPGGDANTNSQACEGARWMIERKKCYFYSSLMHLKLKVIFYSGLLWCSCTIFIVYFSKFHLHERSFVPGLAYNPTGASSRSEASQPFKRALALLFSIAWFGYVELARSSRTCTTMLTTCASIFLLFSFSFLYKLFHTHVYISTNMLWY
jgi:hypothetical protein